MPITNIHSILIDIIMLLLALNGIIYNILQSKQHIYYKDKRQKQYCESSGPWLFLQGQL